MASALSSFSRTNSAGEGVCELANGVKDETVTSRSATDIASLDRKMFPSLRPAVARAHSLGEVTLQEGELGGRDFSRCCPEYS